MRLRPSIALSGPLAIVVAGTVACGGSEEPPSAGAPRDAATEPLHPFEGELTPDQRGEYLVKHVAGCAECHTPHGDTAGIDEAELLSGAPNLFDLDPDDPERGAVHAKNLTSDPKVGLGNWTDEEIKRAFLEGIGVRGNTLHPTMPYWAFHNMRPEDADAIVAYLRTVPPIEKVIPERQPMPPEHEWDAPAMPVPQDRIPESTLAANDPGRAAADRGRYLAGEIGFCLYCHTRDEDPTDAYAVNLDAIFLGRRPFAPVELTVPPPPGANVVIESMNLTPHENGIRDLTPEMIRDLLLTGRNFFRLSSCPPMPTGPTGGFALLTDRDALDLGAYFTTLPPRDNGPIDLCCKACHDEGDAGTGDAGAFARVLPPPGHPASCGMP